MCWLVGPPVFRGTPRGDAAAYAPGDALPGLVGPVPAGAGLRARACMRPPLSDRFLMDYYPRPLEGGPLLPYATRPPWAPPKSVLLANPHRSRPPGAGSGTQGALCLEHGAPSCPSCKSLGWGISRCCRAGHKGHTNRSAGPRCPRVPPWVAPGRQVLLGEDRRAGAVALSSWLGSARRASQALPASGRPASRRRTALPKTLGARPSSAVGTDNSRPPKCPKLNLLADQGGSVSEGPAHPGGGDADPFSPPPTAGGDNSGPVAAGAEVSSGPTGAPQGSPNPPSPEEQPHPAGSWASTEET